MWLHSVSPAEGDGCGWEKQGFALTAVKSNDSRLAYTHEPTHAVIAVFVFYYTFLFT